MTYKDLSGRILKAGDWFVCARTFCGVTQLHYGKVTQIEGKKFQAVVIDYSVQKYSGRWYKNSRVGKPAYLNFPWRILKITKRQAPSSVGRKLARIPLRDTDEGSAD